MRYFYYLLILFFAVSLQTQAQNNYAFDVNGPVMFRVLDQAELDVTGDFTIEAWIQFNNFNGRLCDRTGVLKIYATTNSIRFDLDNGGGSISTGDISADAGDNSWHHIAVARDNASSTTRLFYDGVEKASFDFALIASDQPFSIGGQDAWYGNWDARIDEFRFSNSCRYTTDFTPTVNDAPFVDDANTILLFHFDDNTKVPAENDGSITYSYGNGRSSGANLMASDDYVAPTGLPLPVELTSFTAANNGNEAILNWQTATEVNNYGFEVQRALDNSNNFETLDFIEGYGNSNSTKSYSYTDKSLVNGKYFYRLKQIDIDGQFEYSDVVAVEIGTPVKYALLQNYPNPFNPTTTIQFSIPEAANVNLTVFNALGEQVSVLADGLFDAGMHKVNFNASNLSSGIYFYQIKSQDFLQIKKMMLVK